MWTRWIGLGGLLVALGAGCTEAPRGEAGMAAERDFYRTALWDDGDAEVAQYRVVERRYGTLREGSATLIVVKETFDADALVKADGPRAPDRTLEVMKLNHVLTTLTGVYTYRQMASVFLARADARPVKLVTSSQEWCGITHKRMAVRAPEATLHASSYFGDEAERAFALTIDERTVLFDALPMWLRTLDLSRPGAREVRLVPAQLSNRATAIDIAPATLSVGAAAPIEVPAGAFEAVPVTVEHAGGTDVFHLMAEAPHTMVRWDRSDGGHYALEWVRRAPYWEMHDLEHVGAFATEPGSAVEADSEVGSGGATEAAVGSEAENGIEPAGAIDGSERDDE